MAVDGFWLFEGLADEPYGLLPLHNLNTKNGPTSTKQYDRVGSYQWYLEDETPTIIIPGMPFQSNFWPGGKLAQDAGVVIYDVNHLKCPTGSMDPAILAAKHIGEKKKKPIDFNDYDFITDAVNLQKLFAFAQEAGDGLFRIDCERVGKTVILSRVEASDLMEIGHLTYDQHLKGKMNKPRSQFTTGPFYQLVHYQFGDFKMLVRYEVDSGDYIAGKEIENKFENDKELPSKKKFDENKNIEYVDYGFTSKLVPLQLLTTYPEGAGFPFFTWAQLFFTGVDQTFVGWFKGNGDFKKPAVYSLPDISKLMKPLPYVVLCKVHDCLKKIHMFLTKNDPEFRCGLIWKGKPHLEIFEKFPEANGAISEGVRKLLETQCKDIYDQDEEEQKQ
uniref:Protein kinase domain-containing protein n=2 Tax=Strongyloides stercoralis TaxID=6248 RepID=A0A0K0EN51_STRER